MNFIKENLKEVTTANTITDLIIFEKGSNIPKRIKKSLLDTEYVNTSTEPLRYVINLNQSSTNAPVPTILFNNTGFTPVWAYVGVGIYTCTSVGNFGAGTQVWIAPSSNEGRLNTVVIDDDDTISVYTQDHRTGQEGVPINNALLNTAFEIRKYN